MALPPNEESRVLGPMSAKDPELRALVTRLGGFIDNQPAQFTLVERVASTFQFQVVDRLRAPWKQRFVGVVYHSSTENGPPTAASGWVVNDGVHLQALTGTPLQGFIVLTDEDGIYDARIEHAPPATDFWIHASVIGRFVHGGPFQT